MLRHIGWKHSDPPPPRYNLPRKLYRDDPAALFENMVALELLRAIEA